MLEAVDAHSTSVANRHYILKGPADDAALAKQLVHAMLGCTVPWPVPGMLEHQEGDVVAWAPAGQDDNEATNMVDEESDDELEWFDLSELFGIPKPLLPLEDSQPQSGPRSAAAIPLQDAAFEGEGSRGSGESGTFAKRRRCRQSESERDATDGGAPPLTAPPSLPRPDFDQLPPLLLGIEGASPETTARLNARAEEASAIIRLPQRDGHKTRYYLTPKEEEWMENVVDQAREAGMSDRPNRSFFERLYQWGVREERLNANSSPEGLRSAFGRIAKRRNHPS